MPSFNQKRIQVLIFSFSLSPNRMTQKWEKNKFKSEQEFGEKENTLERHDSRTKNCLLKSVGQCFSIITILSSALSSFSLSLPYFLYSFIFIFLLPFPIFICLEFSLFQFLKPSSNRLHFLVHSLELGREREKAFCSKNGEVKGRRVKPFFVLIIHERKGLLH